MGLIHKILDRLFTRVEVGRPGQYLNRWQVRKLKDGRAIYIHQFLGADQPEIVHDHPKWFTSIGLWGSYVDCFWDEHAGYKKYQQYDAPWCRSFPAEFKHHIWLPEGKTCWTLVITGSQTQEWGFYPNEHYVPHEFFLKLLDEHGTDNRIWKDVGFAGVHPITTDSDRTRSSAP